MNSNLDKITHLFSGIPGISKKLAERLAIVMVERDENVDTLREIIELSSELSKDPLTGLIVGNDKEPNEGRERDVLLVLETNRDVINFISKTSSNKSMFVLDMEHKKDFKDAKTVLDRLFKVLSIYKSKEILFLLSPSIENELIMRVIKEEFKESGLEPQPVFTRISMGIPFGGSIEFSDQRTIKEAMKNREKA